MLRYKGTGQLCSVIGCIWFRPKHRSRCFETLVLPPRALSGVANNIVAHLLRPLEGGLGFVQQACGGEQSLIMAALSCEVQYTIDSSPRVIWKKERGHMSSCTGYPIDPNNPNRYPTASYGHHGLNVISARSQLVYPGILLRPTAATCRAPSTEMPAFGIAAMASKADQSQIKRHTKPILQP